MLATVDSQDLGAACRTVSPALGGTRAVHSMLRLDTDSDSVRIRARNDQWGIDTKVPAFDTEAGSILVPGRAFQLFVASIDGSVTFTWPVDHQRLLVDAGESKMKLTTGDVNDWIDPPTEKAKAIKIPSEDLERLSRVLFAASKDLMRPILRESGSTARRRPRWI